MRISRVGFAVFFLSATAQAQVLDGTCATSPYSNSLGTLIANLDGAFTVAPKAALSNVTIGFEVTVGSTKYSASETSSVEITCSGATVSTSSEVKVGKTKSGKVPDLFGAKLTGEAGVGFSTSSELTVPMPQACELLGELPPEQHGELSAACGATCGANASACDGFDVDPTIFDPMSIPDGGTLVIADSAFGYASASASIPLHALVSAEIGQTVTSGISYSTAVTREGCIVTVVVGPTEFIESAIKLGIKLGKSFQGIELAATAYFEMSDRLEVAALVSYQFDVCTESGGAAYDQLVTEGTEPKGYEPTKIESWSWSSKRNVGVTGEASTGGATVSVDVKALFNSLGRSSTRITSPDGTVTDVATFSLKHGELRVGFVMTYPASGCPVVDLTYPKIHPETAKTAAWGFCGADALPQFEGEQDLTVRIDCNEWMTWRERACAATKAGFTEWSAVCEAQTFEQFVERMTHLPIAADIGGSILELADQGPVPGEFSITNEGCPLTGPGRRCK